MAVAGQGIGKQQCGGKQMGLQQPPHASVALLLELRDTASMERGVWVVVGRGAGDSENLWCLAQLTAGATTGGYSAGAQQLRWETLRS